MDDLEEISLDIQQKQVRAYLGCISGVSRLYLGRISGVSRAYLGRISAVSRLYLGCISQNEAKRAILERRMSASLPGSDAGASPPPSLPPESPVDYGDGGGEEGLAGDGRADDDEGLAGARHLV